MPTPQPSIGAEKSTMQGQVESLLRTNTVAYQTNRATIEKEGIKLFAITSLRLSAALIITSALATLLALVAYSPAAQAHHSLGKYHWARTSNPFTLQLDDNVSNPWDTYLTTTSSDWSQSNQSSVLRTTVNVSAPSNPTCSPTSRKIEVCNAAYGTNGWLGLAQIWISSRSHITAGTTKVNDTYFNTAKYNTPAWRQMVMCQEVGHTFGLDHQDENFNNINLGTCMDYTNDPSTNQHPNQGDYDELLCVYDPTYNGVTLSTTTHSCTGTGHLDRTTTVGRASAASTMPPAASRGSFNSRAKWGQLIRQSRNERLALYERDFGGGKKLVTCVIWA